MTEEASKELTVETAPQKVENKNKEPDSALPRSKTEVVGAKQAVVEEPKKKEFGLRTNSFGNYLDPALHEEMYKTKTRPLSASSNGSLTADEPPMHRKKNPFVKAIST